MEDVNVDNTEAQQDYPPDDDGNLETHKAIIRRSLAEIAADVGTEMRNAGLTFALGLTVPDSGPSLITIVSPADPTDDDWMHATAIVRLVAAKKLGGISLNAQPLPCTMANGTMTAAEIIPNALAFRTASCLP
jgi:hypothetical protein